jgi:pimeloyl-ACP methyl ester carboxylesterase
LLRVFSFDCRGHGLTTPLGPLERLAFSSFADDLRTILDSMAVDKAIVGGISMGAGIALNFATRNPDRVTALILARPAWLDRARPRNLEILRTISRLLREHGVERTKQLVAADPEFLRIQCRIDPATAGPAELGSDDCHFGEVAGERPGHEGESLARDFCPGAGAHQ